MTLATLLHKRGQPLAAGHYYYRLLLHEPDDVNVLLSLGHCIVACNNLPTAREVFEHVLTLEPDNVTAQVNLVHVLRRLDLREDGGGHATTHGPWAFPA